MRWTLAAGLALALIGVAMAEPAPPVQSAAVSDLKAGMLCMPQIAHTEPAPDTELGYITIPEGTPEITIEDRVVPAAIGLSFGVSVIPTETIEAVEMRSYRPGQTDPDSFPGRFEAGAFHFHYFSFEFPSEQLPGLWRLEAWDGARQLYSVEFEVVPAATMPDLVARCQAIS